ncbi:snRNA-activating protein complex subunit 4 isoform X2 [Amia ocellicauda]|uniref:snRNA-activating protein complex subunit 4 isoform X2 n=1 Tax=Amia ocellicauda TaxID=2972642 RepID=UPI00346387CD
MASRDLLTERERIRREIEELERNLRPGAESAELLSSDWEDSEDELESEKDEDSEGSGQQLTGLSSTLLSAKREKIQQEIEELERTLGPAVTSAEVVLEDEEGDDKRQVETSGEDSDDNLGLPEDAETCLQMNLVYQEVIEEKLLELERLLADNKEQQKEILSYVSGPPAPKPTSPDLPPLKLFLGNFLKPYFKDKSTGLGPPANPETREKMSQGVKPFEDLVVKKWEGWQKSLLHSAVVRDRMKRLLQPKLLKVEYMTQKMSHAKDMEKQILEKQITQTEREIEDISAMSEEQLLVDRTEEHDWDKISNIDFEGTRNAEDIKRYWQNYEHPGINKKAWKEDEIERLKEIAAKHDHWDWESIAEELGTNRTAFMCLQTYQRYINKGLRKKFWTKEEDQMLKDLVEKMRIGNYIPYTQISYFMEGREATQLVYRWTQCLDPSLKKGHWSKEEDEMLLKAVAKYGTRDWWKIRDEVPGRSDSQCRDRYVDCLSEDVKKGKWSPEEETKLIMLVQKYGAGRWAKIASEMENRVDSQCMQKWKSLRGPKRIRKRKPRIRKRRKKLPPVPKEEPLSSESEDLEMELMSSGEEKEPDSDPDGESEVSDEKDDYTMPNIDLWIPKGSVAPPHAAALCGPANKCNPADAKKQPRWTSLGRLQSGNSRVPGPSPGIQHSMVIGGAGCPSGKSHSTTTPVELLEKASQSGKKILKVTYNQLKGLLRPKTAARLKTRIKEKEREKEKETMAGSTDSPEQQKRAERRTLSSHLQNCKLNESLLMAVTPWVGSVLMPLGSERQRRRREADVIREKAEEISLTSTPVFMLLIKVFNIDVEGCRRVIEERKKMESAICNKPAPVVRPVQTRTLPTPQSRSCSAPPPISNVKTVAQILYEKRSREARMKSAAQKKNMIMYPSIMMPQTFMIPQPLRPLLPSPVVTPGPPASTPSNTSAGEAKSAEGNKRSIKRSQRLREKAQVPKGPSSAGSSGQEMPTKNAPDPPPVCVTSASVTGSGPNPSQVTPALAQGPMFLSPITWIMTPQGLFPLGPQTVIGVQAANYAQTPVLVNQNGPMTVSPSFGQTGVSFSNMPQVTGSSVSQAVSTPSSLSAPSLLPVGPFQSAGILSPFVCTPTSSPAGTTSMSPVTSNHTLPNPTTSATSTLPSPATSMVSSAAVPMNVLPQAGSPAVRPIVQSQNVINVGQTTIPKASAKPPAGPVPSTLQLVSTGPHKRILLRKLEPTQPSSPATATPESAPKPQPPTGSSASKADKTAVDLNLMFVEEVSQVKEWLKGKGGVQLPNLNVALPYLPPFTCNLKTLSGLLVRKECLERSASALVSAEGGQDGSQAVEVEAIRRVVAENLGNNPAYLLLKARFLSCFTLPAFLATVPPPKGQSECPFTFNSDSSDLEECATVLRGEENKRKSPTTEDPTDENRESDLRCENEGRPEEASTLLCTEGAIAHEFTGMRTRRRSRFLKVV